MASITQSTLDIPDSYTSVSSSAGKFPPTSPIRGLPGDPEWQPAGDEPNPERTTHSIDENMKTLIQVTGIWVALRQGLSPYFRYNDAMASSSASSPIQRSVSTGGRMRALSITPDTGRASPAGTVSSTPESTQNTFGGRIRSKCVKGSPSVTTSPQFEHGGQPKRSVSTGSAFMQRAAARRAGNLPSTVASDSEGEGTFFPPKRAATVDLTGGLGSEMSMSQHRSLPGSSATPIDTPTKPQRRTQSVYVPSGVHQNGLMNGNVDRHSVDFTNGKQTAEPIGKTKISRWKAFKDFFRRSHSATRSG